MHGVSHVHYKQVEGMLQVLAIEFVTLVIEFVTLANESSRWQLI